MAFSFVEHNNKEVLLANHRGLAADELIKSIREVNLFLADKKKDYLLVADFSDTNISKDVNEYLQGEETRSVAKYITKQAIVGITGIKKMILNLYNKLTGTKSGVFDTINDALEYVTKL